ncbi:MAG: Arginine--tRNA ligase [Microgenomates bacterium OLB23]|nr:MAG: Arginine--tRNA ligase [Microgenomates bacterium OLB23]
MLKERVQQAIAEALGSTEFTLLYPRDKAFGDFAINIHQLKKLALNEQALVEKLSLLDIFEKVELVQGFVNMRVAYTEYLAELNAALRGGTQPAAPNPHAQRINLEFGQPNTHKLPHIGHLFSYAYGESMARLLAWDGHTVFRSNYQGDVGLHVAKCLYIFMQRKDDAKNLSTLEDKVRFLQTCYQDGSAAYDENSNAKTAIDAINKAIYNRDDTIHAVWEETRSWSVAYYKKFEERIGTTYDRYFFESETSDLGTKLVQEHIDSVFTESDGAVVFKGEQFGLHTRVFLTTHGTPTYEAKDIGLIALKKQEWPFDTAVITTASEQNAYWQVVKKAIELIFPELQGKIMHIGFGMIDLKGSKMSSRTGNIVSAIDLIEIVKKKCARELVKKWQPRGCRNNSHWGRKICLFKNLKQKKNMIFDLEQSISVQGNSGPYLQYTYARLRSVLAKAQYEPSALQNSTTSETLSSEDYAILRMLPTFSDVAHQAAVAYSPHLLCTYVYDLAQACNLLYDKQSILKAPQAQRELRLALLEAASRTIKTSLNLLGIDVLERI